MARNKSEISSGSYESILKDASKQKEKVFKLSRIYPAFIVLIVLLGASYAVWILTNNMVSNDRQREFDKAVTSVMSRLESKEQRKVEVVESMSGLYEILVQVVKDYFELYATVPTKTYPSIISLLYAPKVEKADLDLYLFNARSQGYYEYNLHPDGERDIYFPTEHIIPFTQNEHRLGYDFATDENLMKKIEQARDENKVISTPFFNVRPDTLGFYIMAPIYVKDSPKSTLAERKANFQGLIMLEMNASLFFQKAIASGKNDDGNTAFPSDSTILFRIVDEDFNGNEQIVYNSANAGLLEQDYKPYVTAKVPYTIAGRNLRVEFFTIPNFGGAFQAYLPIVATGLSLLLSIMFFGFVLSVLTSRARAVDLADRMTRSQRRIVEASKDIIAVMDFAGVWKSMNPASQEVFGLSPEEMISSNVDTLFYDEEAKREFFSLIEAKSSTEHTERIVVRMRDAAGNMKWISWSLTITPQDKLVYAIGRDVTLEKLAEEEAIKKSKQIQLAELYAREASEAKTFFMTKLSHLLRNSLTGIIGYLQLISQKIYDSEEEHDTFVNLAEESSEEIFTFVSDIVDATVATDVNSSYVLETSQLKQSFGMASAKLKAENPTDFEYKLEDGALDCVMLTDTKTFADSLEQIFKAYATGLDKVIFTVNAQENKYEGVTEIQILGSGNPDVEEMIGIYKDNTSNLIDALAFDKQDILLNLASAASSIRRMNGTMTVETFGGDEGNLVMISMPLNKKSE